MTLKGKRIVITGVLEFYTRSEAFAEIVAAGGIPQQYVTRETDFLVVGYYRPNMLIDGKSKKYRTAERYISSGSAINIISGETFLRSLWWD